MRDLKWLSAVVAIAALAACQSPPGSEAPPAPDGETTEPGAVAAPTDARASERAPAARPAAAPRPAPTPEPLPISVPAGAELKLELRGTYSSGESRAGDAVLAVLLEDVRVEERVVLPAGSEVRGRVVAAQGSGRVKGRARLALGFETVTVDGHAHPIDASGIDVTADNSKKRDAAIIGGGAGAGAIIGGIAKGGKGAAVGAAIGGAAGTGAVLATKGKEVVFPANSQVRIVLQSELRLL